MGISTMRPFLRSLCCNTPWDYAIFWKIMDQHQKILVWEDSFCDILKPRNPMLGPVEKFYLGNSKISSAFTSNVNDGTSSEIGLAVTEMTSASHLMGKGVIGKAAVTGKSQWIYSVNLATGVYDPVSVSEYPDDWLLQFIAGIKTILLLPVLPVGVLQLGSLEMVAENEELCASLQNKFHLHISTVGCDLGSSTGHFFPFVETSIISTDEEYEDHKAIWAKAGNLSAKQMLPVSTADLCNTSAMTPANTVANGLDSKTNQESSHVAEQCQLLSEEDIYNVTEHKNAIEVPCFDLYHGTAFGDLNDFMDFHLEESVAEPTTCFDLDNTFCHAGISFSSFSGDLELHKTLQPTVVSYPYQSAYNSAFSDVNGTWSSIGYGDPFYGINFSSALSTGLLMNEDEVDYLLDAVVANSSSSTSDDNSTNVTNVAASLNSPPDKPVSSPVRPHDCKQSALVKENSVHRRFLNDSFIAQGRDNSPNFSASASSGESIISALTDKHQDRKERDSVKPEKLSRLSRTSKRRVHSGDNQRPRPRDRQLIQDRIKELRELVPNSGKCSIDGLLDKTVKHMLHLRRMTDQADKLSQVLKEGMNKKTTRTDESSCPRQNGTSWAVELGKDMQSCPIVVKDLDPPGHMLIEMLCTDFNRFLEITDVIHRSQLTILKGVMENSSDDPLARFVVEASGSFHRLDIFWPLMQLLQQKSPSIAAVA